MDHEQSILAPAERFRQEAVAGTLRVPSAAELARVCLELADQGGQLVGDCEQLLA